MGKTVTIIFSMVDWAALKQRPQYLASYLCKSRQVIYVENIGLRRIRPFDLPLILKKLISFVLRFIAKAVGRSQGHLSPEVGLEIVSPFTLPFLRNNAIIRAVNSAVLLRQIKRRLQGHDYDRVEVIVNLPSQTVIDTMSKLCPDLVVYDCLDEMAHFPNVNASDVARVEQQLVSTSDIVFATSRFLYNRLARLNKHTFLVENGFEKSVFDQKEYPLVPELENIHGPIIGYVGAVHDWIDLGLLENVARSLPQAHFVLVGPISNSAQAEAQGLRQLNNVLFLGAKKHHDIPSILKYFTVAIIPFKITPLTRAVNPIKLYEYWSMGLPVVATKTEELIELECYGPLLLSEGIDDFVRNVSGIISGHQVRHDSRQLQDFLDDHTWPSITNRVIELINNVKKVSDS